MPGLSNYNRKCGQFNIEKSYTRYINIKTQKRKKEKNVNNVNKYICTIDQELVYAAAKALADASCLLTKWQHFSA